MKLKCAPIAALATAALLLSSCYYYGPAATYGTYTYTEDGYTTTVEWTSASYDVNGFPIYGYYYGRPVYGYTAAGAAIFSIAALTAYCYVPHWAPAPWYHGRWHYPAHIHRTPRPPHFPSSHRPGIHPPGGMNAPIHRDPGAVFGPGSKPGHRPGGAAPHPGGHRPGGAAPAPGGHRPGGAAPHPGGHRPGGAAPRPGGHRPGGAAPRPGGHRPGGIAPRAGGHRPGGMAPRAGGHRPGGFGGGPRGGGHGGHRR